MASFELPPIKDNPDGGWGPSPSNFPPDFKFKDIPYAPFSKTDKLGRYADWNDLTGDNRLSATNTAGGTRPAGATGRRREGQQTFGSGIANAFAVFQVEDEASFSLVDNKSSAPRRGGPGGFGRNRGGPRTAGAGGRTGQRGGRGGFQTGRGGAQRGGGRRGWRDWEKVGEKFHCWLFCEATQYRLLRTRERANRRLLYLPHGKCWRRSSFIAWPNFGWMSMNPMICECKEPV